MSNKIIIDCMFAGSDKAYGYVTTDETIKPGDFVIVESNKPTDRVVTTVPGVEGRPLNILTTVEVLRVDVPKLDNIKYKPIVQKIDLTEYLTLTGEI